MNINDVESVVYETIEKGTPKPIWNGKVHKSDGKISTAFPEKGSAVWDNVKNIWINKV